MILITYTKSRLNIKKFRSIHPKIRGIICKKSQKPLLNSQNLQEIKLLKKKLLNKDKSYW